MAFDRRPFESRIADRASVASALAFGLFVHCLPFLVGVGALYLVLSWVAGSDAPHAQAPVSVVYQPTIEDAAPERQARSPHWPALRRQHLAAHPACEACGARAALEVHHVKPFHLAPELELDPGNLITLCRQPGGGCHFWLGHLRDFQGENPDIFADAAWYRAKLDASREAIQANRTR